MPCVQKGEESPWDHTGEASWAGRGRHRLLRLFPGRGFSPGAIPNSIALRGMRGGRECREAECRGHSAWGQPAGICHNV